MCFKEWNFWVYERDIQGKNWLECPSCEVNQHSCHVDGNAKLYRYKSSGRRKRPTFYVNGLFSSNDKVEKYIRKIYGEKRGTNKIETDYHCGGVWNAAKNAKKKTNSLDETGIELASCRHRIAQKALNMFQGELFGYPLYLMKTFMAEKNVKFCFADVMCKLWKFVKQHEPSLPSLLRPALSVMHAKGHALNCQILWSGEWLEGTGKSTGEETEQVFGYLSRCGNTTKHQTPENREETITEMAMFWNKRKILNIIKELSRRFLKCKHDIVKADDALTKVKQDTGLHEMEKEVDKWINDMKVSASGFLSNAVNRKLTSNEKFVLLLDDMQHLPCAAPFLVLLDGLHFPKTIKKGYYYRFLEFGLEEKQHELQRLLNIPACIESILESYSLLKNDIWKPIYQTEIDKAFMVKVSWECRSKKLQTQVKDVMLLERSLALLIRH
ncbi:uncharacterized protein LOC130648956 isoform X2 [Hydractinia symbiolongicarpus]|uniref:uncharacterized protein LOC130648956 isoform X2 n=1 Tax=Hydractinia symbiolongicarpus TaxID=13093 RepID=UPI00254D916A|nr:uncharacterized protein LOC130648956 isoform X2 [Hydractinia symbiolongicarpus]